MERVVVDLGRREFLRIVGLAGTATAIGGCSEPTRRLIPYLTAPEDVVPGTSSWYASTCRECPAGCGLLAKNRDGRIIKVEGNPLHPVSGGKLCARGQSSLQGLYNPDRFPCPLKRTAQGGMDPISWEEGEDILSGKLKEIIAKGGGRRIAFVTDLITGTQKDLANLWLSNMGQTEGVLIYEPLSYEPLRRANQIVFGSDSIPYYRIDQADFLISFNAGFLETWLSNIEYARQFAIYHTVSPEGKNPFVFVGPRLSMTANNADFRISVAPGDEYLIALGMLRVMLDENLANGISPEQRKAVSAMTASWPLDKVVSKTGVPEKSLRSLARMFAGAKKPLALAEGLSFTVPNATETAVAANLLCSMNPGSMACIDFESRSAYSDVSPVSKFKDLSDRMKKGEIDLLLVYRANPVFSLPPSWEFEKSIKSVPMVVSFSSLPDETSEFAHLVLPASYSFETWGDYSPRKGVTGLLQPVMGNLFKTKPFSDILISTGKKAWGAESFAWKDSYEMLQDAWAKKLEPGGADDSFETLWEKAVERGGQWGPLRLPPGGGYGEVGSIMPEGEEKISFISKRAAGLLLVAEKNQPSALKPAERTAGAAGSPSAQSGSNLSSFSFPAPGSEARPEGGFYFTTYPTVQFFDGRQANRPWIQELPDPITMITWDGWVEVCPETAQKHGIEKGDILRLKSPYGSIDVPAVVIDSVPTNTFAVPIGQGHTAFGRYAANKPVNPMRLFSGELDEKTGGMLRKPFIVTIEKQNRNLELANLDGSFTDQGRGIVQVMNLSDFKENAASGRKPELYLPLPEGYDPTRDFYPVHQHVDYRWGMVVDLDRCIGCSACVAACYAENNLAVVGKEQVIKGRIMSWVRIERFFDPEKPSVHWLPMLCQQCDNAPCESVCPVYAPHHSKEGLNNQVYNRCIGTRFCLQNDPYKVRRFNWFTFTHDVPLNFQLNPDVTARQKGVMEKCSFCIQRIVDARTRARNEGRKVRDGEFTTACAQSCPTDAIVFGNLMDPSSRVARLMKDTRAYQVMAELNTKPAVIYLKRVTETMEV